MTSKSFLEIDDLNRGDHPFLEATDHCLYYGEYTSRLELPSTGGPVNQCIANFKKGMEKKGGLDWPYKAKAVKEIAKTILDCFPLEFMDAVTWVPVPPSKAKTDPLYDDRIAAVLEKIRESVPTLDVRELVVQTVTLDAAHKSTDKRNPNILANFYQFQRQLLTPPLRDVIAVFDDVLTTGSHFRAMTKIILKNIPDAQIIGVFYARAVPKSDLMTD